jgi:MFS family permease
MQDTDVSRTFTVNAVVPVAGHIVQDLDGHERKSASVLLVTIWELGEAAGPLLIAPLSELYGRYPVFNAANGLFIIGVIVAGLSQSSATFIFARFLTGLAVASNVLNPAIIGDMFSTESRGSAMSLIMLAPLLGGAVGPAIAGAIVQSATWRHIMWMSLALAGTAELAFLMLFRETYKVPILKRRAARLRRETGDETLKTAFDGEDTGSELWAAIKKPAFVFFGSFVLQITSLYGAMSFSYFYIMSTTLPDILQDVYGFDPALTGTSFLSFSELQTRNYRLQLLTASRHWVYLRSHRIQFLIGQDVRPPPRRQ